MNRQSEIQKVDIGVAPATLSNTNTTGRYFDMSKYGRALFILQTGALASMKVASIYLLEATDASGSDSQTISGSTATITANTNVTVATIDVSSAAATDVVTVNGLAYTMAAATTAASRTWSSIAALASDINDATYGVSGVTATAATTVITLTATDPGETLITLSATNGSGTITVATTQAQAYVDLDASMMDLADGFTHVAPYVESTGAGTVSVAVLRGQPRVTPTQKVADYEIV